MTLGDQPAFPKDGSPYGYQGMTYRMWLVGQIAGDVYSTLINNMDPEKAKGINLEDSVASIACGVSDAIIARMEDSK